MSGEKDVANLFNRVTALEQEDTDEDQTVTTIVKTYETIGLTITINLYLHQYRTCGDTNPLYAARTAADNFI